MTQGENQPAGKDTPTRVRIREAARVIFYGKGFRSTSVEEIAAAASVSRATIYLHFQNKDEILLDILTQDLEDQIGHYRHLAGLKRVDLPAVRKWLGTFHRAMEARRGSLGLFSSALSRSPTRRASIENHRERIVAILGGRFAGFDLDALGREARSAQRIKCYCMLFMIEGAAMTFASADALFTMEMADDPLAAMLLHFMHSGEISSEASS